MARNATHKKMVLCIRLAFKAVVAASPVKYKAKGSDPPIMPMATNFNSWVLVREDISFHFLKASIIPIINTATNAFFSVVKTIGSLTAVTAILVRKLFVPEITAVDNARIVA